MQIHLHSGRNPSLCSQYGTSSLSYFFRCLLSSPSTSLFLHDPHLPFVSNILPSFGPAALPFLPCHICHRRSLAGVALGFKFNLVSICCNCFERWPCLHVFPLLCLLEYWIGCVCSCVRVCVCVRARVCVRECLRACMVEYD